MEPDNIIPAADDSPPAPPPVTPPPAEKPAAPIPTARYADSQTALVVPRVIINYIVVAVLFFGLGALVASAGYQALFNANSQENAALMQRAVGTLVAAGGGGGAEAAQLRPGQRYEVVADTDPALGPADAAVTIIEFSDFRCPYCRRHFEQTLQPLLANYGDRMRMVFRDFPILGPSSYTAALAGNCAFEQGKFWEFHDLTYSNQDNLTREAFIQHATDLELDVAVFTECLDTEKYADEVQADASYAANLGVTGTPAFFINGRFISGAQPYDVFAQLIDEELAQAATS